MTITYTTTVKTARMQAVIDAIGSGGKLKLLTSADAVLATFTLATPAGTSASGVLTFSDQNGATAGILNTTATAAGTAAKAVVTTSADANVVTGLTVGTSGADLILDNTSLSLGQGVTITSATFTHAA